MKKLLSTKYSAGAFNTGLLILRLGAGILMVNHGYNKLVGFNEMSSKFVNFVGIGSEVTLALVIFAELFCAALIVIGLFTRLACIPLIISCAYALAKAHKWNVFEAGELATLFLAAFLTLFFTGPGRISVDNMISK